jgi:hypothetical protein
VFERIQNLEHILFRVTLKVHVSRTEWAYTLVGYPYQFRIPTGHGCQQMRKHVGNFQRLEFIVVFSALSPILLYSPLGFFLIEPFCAC